MNLLEAVERLCEIVKMQAEIIERQAVIIEQSKIEEDVAKELREMRRKAETESNIVNQNYN